MTVAVEHLRLLSDRDRDRLEAAVEQFESAWERGERPQLDAFLTDEADLRPAITVELAIADLEYRLRAGEAVRADDYLDRFPEVRDIPDAPAELMAVEDRWRIGRAAADTAVPGDSVPPGAGDPPLPTVPGYELLGELGRGGMGVVYKARQIAADRIVALKMIRTEAEAAEPDLVARFRTEAEAAARLQHPHIVQIFEVGEHGGRPFFAMELVEGGTLADRLAAGPLPPADAAALLLPLARAVDYAHRRGVLHRDIKPANVLMQRTEDRGQRTENDDAGLSSVLCPLSSVSPKVSDFGLAKRLDRASDQTRTGAVIGTPSFMAPEQAAGPSRELTPAADIYALGATLYACLTGRPPFQAATVLETIEQVRTCEPVALRLLQPGVPRDLETICLKCLCKEPAGRYASAADLAADLERFRDGRPIVARPIGAVARAIRWCRRNPAVAGLAAALAVLLPAALVTVSLLYWQAEAQRGLAVTAARRAEEKSELARTTVDDLLSTLGNKLATSQDIPKVRREMYEKALALYRRFADEPGGATPAVRRGEGRLLGRLGALDRDLGRLPAALTALRRSEDILRQLAEERPDDTAVRRDLAYTLQLLGGLRRMTGAGPGAAAAYRESADLFARLMREAPDDPFPLNGYGASLNNLAIVLNEAGRPDEALAAQQELVDRNRRFVAEARPHDPGPCARLGTALSNYGLMQERLGRREAAADSLREALALFEDAAAADPKAPGHREGLANAAISQSDLLARLKRSDEAVAASRRAVAVLTRLTGDFPDLPRYRHRLAQAHSNLGSILATAGRLAEADRDFGAALALLERLVVDYPAVTDYRVQLSTACGNRGESLRVAGKTADALPWLDRAAGLIEPQPALLTNAENRHNLALIYHMRATALAALGRDAEAIRDWDKAGPLAAQQDQLKMQTARAMAVARAGDRPLNP